MLETPEGNKEITTGDIIVCPPSEKGAHRIMNTSDTEVLTYLDFDTAHIPDIVHYPHSDKIGVMEHNQSSKFYKNETEVGYYEGE